VNWSNARKEIAHVNVIYVTLARRSHVYVNWSNARKEVTYVNW
jgi:hypothetical protein